ncbi:cell filamentation protein Fic [Vibrio breoganii]|uniref:Cell filamentation protein Fic n=1 Tax=Vibrio breoganii TaxID=553239 RepID=A0AAP8MUQ2_9VIBR|nr:Fic family protein [Vibrio breoganii]PMG02588.1 cell filamentation protein Fic [Vibrio breoganii]PMO80922.1 cell filamentation protein Fic [Vibrio breoganii]PMP08973.1 cell filamentation protein Fic [Vibrio breoganii]
MWIWEQPDWPAFQWDRARIEPILRETRLHQGVLLGKMSAQSLDHKQSMLDTLLANIVHSSAIEGEKLNAFSVRSSLANKLGVSEEKPFPTTKQTDGLADIMLDAIERLEEPLTLERILHWHEKLFPSGYTLFNPVEGGRWRGDVPMQVVSGRIDKPKVHFEAPSRQVLDKELDQFVEWFNTSKADALLDPLLRAAITHLWCVTLHPLDDGNGRITRLLTDLALAQADKQSVRFYAMSVGIMANRKSYYEILEQTQKGDLVITEWIVWFCKVLNETFSDVLDEIEQTIQKTNYWRKVDQVKLSPEQTKVLNRLLDGDFPEGINTSQYHKVTKVSKPTATRHLAYLVEIGCIEKTGAGGRSTRYVINKA